MLYALLYYSQQHVTEQTRVESYSLAVHLHAGFRGSDLLCEVVLH